ncbi:MAG: glutathione S-transferase, partial [Gammaproteobacteria bacterium]|nr:glutathione S-transferase [Gammaproteobacteria bacterium]
MKLYEYESFPSPRRVRMFLAEKGINIPCEQIDVPAGEHRSPEYLSKNPDGVVPLLELDSGDYISETVAISRYFEENNPQMPLMGRTAEEKALIEMWQRRVENSLTNTVHPYFHHATEGLGEPDRYRNREWGEKNREKAISAMKQLNNQLAENIFIVGDKFSIVDITTLCAIDFAAAVNISIPDECHHLTHWYSEVS